MITRTDHYDLHSQNTFGMRVSCECFIEYDSPADLLALDWDSLPRPVLHVGEGSNLLFTGDFPGTVLHSRIRYIKYVDMGADSVPVAVGAGIKLDDFCARACADGLWGAENLSGIPGEVGAAAVQNVGAYGVEIKDILSGVVCYDTHLHRKVSFQMDQCGYGYRDSMFKRPENRGRYVVTGVLLRLRRSYSPKLDYGNIRTALEGTPEPLTPQQVRDAILRIRDEKLPDPRRIGSAGSFFKNPVVPRAEYERIAAQVAPAAVPHYDLPDGTVKIPAAWMIDQCGLKGHVEGNVAVYDKQPLVLVNRTGEAAPEEVVALEQKVIMAVWERFGVELHPEVEHI